MAFNFGTCDALYDTMRAKKKCPTDQWDEFTRFDTNMSGDFQTILRTIVDMTEIVGESQNEERRERTIDIRSEDDCSCEEEDPQCALYWEMLKLCGGTYVEGNSSEEECEVDVQAKRAPGHRNHDDLVQTCCGLDVIALSNRQSDVEIVGQLDKALVLQNSSERFDFGVETRYAGDDESGWSKKDMVGIVDKGKNVVVEDHVAVVRKPGPRNNEATENQIEHVDLARTRDKDKMVYKRKLSKVFQGGQEAKKRAVDNWDVYPSPGPSNNRVTKNQSAHVDQAQSSKIGKAEKVQRKLVKRTNLVMRDHVAVVQKPASRNYETAKVYLERVDGARTRDIDKMVYKRKLSEVVKGGQGANKRPVVQVENRDVYQNPGPSNNRVTKNQCEYVDLTQSSETGKVERKRKLPKKLVNGKHVVKTGHEFNMTRPVVQKSDRRNKCFTEDQRKLVQPARSEKKPRKLKKVVGKGKNIAKEDGVAGNSTAKIENDCQSQKPVSSKLKRKSVVEEEVKGGRKAVVQKPGSRNEYGAGVDQSRPGKKVVVQGNRKLVKVVKKENGHSNLKTDFGTSKNQRDRNVHARSVRKGTIGNLRKAKAANIYHEKDDESDSDVQILDSAAIETNGAMSAFVPSRRFMRSDDESKDLGGASVHADFRTRVLEVLNRPYDREEYKRHRDAVRAGKYFDPYPDLKRKLKTHQYNRGKCLAILRGFFFWLQNVVQEGAFKPWKDGQCLKLAPT